MIRLGYHHVGKNCTKPKYYSYIISEVRVINMTLLMMLNLDRLPKKHLLGFSPVKWLLPPLFHTLLFENKSLSTESPTDHKSVGSSAKNSRNKVLISPYSRERKIELCFIVGEGEYLHKLFGISLYGNFCLFSTINIQTKTILK